VPSLPELSVVLLCYRAEAELARVAGELHAELESARVPYELVLVANYWPGRGDRTPEHAETFAQEHPNVVVIALPKRGDMGFDLRSGLEEATGDHFGCSYCPITMPCTFYGYQMGRLFLGSGINCLYHFLGLSEWYHLIIGTMHHQQRRMMGSHP
jgi:hypothetical protein